ncbi:MAG: AAA family ATPase [Flavobacteriales bacterium]|nr:AAA family ATPase [Flavobacteriales bacterium]
MNNILERYKTIIQKDQLEAEIYKWDLLSNYRGRPDLDAEDLAAEIKSINYHNLMYRLSSGMMQRLAAFDQDRYKQILQRLINEDEDLQLRIDRFIEECNALTAEDDPKIQSYHDERAASVILTFKNPDKYTFYKNSYYKKLCEVLGIQMVKAGQKFVHYLKILKQFRDEYVLKDRELLELVDRYTADKEFKDPERLLLSQDILYQALDANERSQLNPSTTKNLNYRILARVLGNNNEERVRHFFGLIEKLLNAIELDTNDRRLCFNPRNDSSKQISITINFRLVAMLKDSGTVGFMIREDDFNKLGISGVLNRETEFAGDPRCKWISMEYNDFLNMESTLTDLWLKACVEYAPLGLRSSYHKHHVEEIATLALNPAGLKPYFEATPEDYERLKATSGEEPEETYTHPMKPVNRIYYGPPGTGKTHTINHSLVNLYTAKETTITKEKFTENILKDLKWWQVIGMVLYELKKAKVQDIVEHPWIKIKSSFSQVKNLRANIWGHLQERTPLDSEFVKVQIKRQPHIFDKDESSTWRILSEVVEDEVPELIDWIEQIESFNPNPDKVIKRYKFTTFHQSFTYEDFIEGIKPVMDLEQGDGEIRYEIRDGIFKEICIEARNDPDNRYAIFIDEINRGNVAAIFGELITLIEEDKREGQRNAMSLVLPYSKEDFSVPGNLDIYGTMNTADRSIEALDTALRRRFSFEEIQPNPELIRNVGTLEDGLLDDLDLCELLETINQRIEILMDRDHLIGHSYFLKVASWSDLQFAFENEIIPLLQEYFYGDYGKIGLVLGGGFVELVYNNNSSSVFAKFNYEGVEDLAEREVYRLIKHTADSFQEAVRLIVN